MRFLHGMSVGGCVYLGTMGAAGAATLDRSFSLSPASLSISGTASLSSTVTLPKSGTSTFVINFVVPLDHARNTPITVSVYYRTPTTFACNAATILAAGIRRRVGEPSQATGGPNVDRIAPSDGFKPLLSPRRVES